MVRVYPDDLIVSKRPVTSYQINMHFSFQAKQFLAKHDVLCFEIQERLALFYFFSKHGY